MRALNFLLAGLMASSVFGENLAGLEGADGFKDGDYHVLLSQVAGNAGVQFPHQKIPDANYEPIGEKPARMVLRFSEKGKKVLLLPDSVQGELTTWEAGVRREYRLTEGLFAGGRLEMEKTKKGVQVTYTVFGSGVPVISSVRGVGLKPGLGGLDGKKIELTARCSVSKVPNRVYVRVKGQSLSVPLPVDLHGKLKAGDQGWIGLVGVCRMVPQGGPRTAESSDGSIEVQEVLFLDQKKGRKESLKISE